MFFINYSKNYFYSELEYLIVSENLICCVLTFVYCIIKIVLQGEFKLVQRVWLKISSSKHNLLCLISEQISVKVNVSIQLSEK